MTEARIMVKRNWDGGNDPQVDDRDSCHCMSEKGNHHVLQTAGIFLYCLVDLMKV